jgi:hypothetical protein
MEPTLQFTRSDEAGLMPATEDPVALYSNRWCKAVLGCAFALCAVLALSQVRPDASTDEVIIFGILAAAMLYFFARCVGGSFTVSRDDETVTVTHLLRSRTIRRGDVRTFRAVTLRVGGWNRRCLVVIDSDGTVDELHRMVNAPPVAGDEPGASPIDELAHTLNTLWPGDDLPAAALATASPDGSG